MSLVKTSEVAPDSLELVEGELNTLQMSQGSDNCSSSEYEAFVSIDSELESMNAEEPITTEEETLILEESIEDGLENEEDIVEDDIDMADLTEKQEESETVTDQVIYPTPDTTISQSLVFPTKPTFQKLVPATPTPAKLNIPPPPPGQAYMIVSSTSGQGTSQILKIAHTPTGTQSQLQSLAQTFITAKSAEGSIVQLRSAQPGKTLVATTQSSSVTVNQFQSPKTVQTTVKRPAQINPTKTVITKMMIPGNQNNSTTQDRLTSTTNTATTTARNAQPHMIKFINATSNSHPTAPSTKIVTFAQANQMGLLNSSVVNKNQQLKGAPGGPKPGHKIIKVVAVGASNHQPIRSVISKSTSSKPLTFRPPSAPLISTTVAATTAITNLKPTSATSSAPPKLYFATSTPKSSVAFTTSGPSQLSTGPPASSSMIVLPATYVNKKIEESKPPRVYQKKYDLITTSTNPTQTSTSTVTSTSATDTHKLKPISSLIESTDNKMRKSPQAMGLLAPGNVITVGKSKAQVAHGIHKIGAGQRIVKVVPLNSSGQPLRTVAPKSTITAPSGAQRLYIPSNSSSRSNNFAIPTSALTQLTSGVNNIVVVPAQYLQQNNDEKKSKPQSSTSNAQSPPSPTLISTIFSDTSKPSKSQSPSDPNNLRPRKPCNCTKSQCLKLYCDCFANGEFCYMCNCNNCSNNLGNEEERQRAIKSCLERNPNAFRPKIGKARETGDDIRRHNKGCNCKRSGCLKNYCECYEAKIPCSANCKCVGCRNIEDMIYDKQSLMDLDGSPDMKNGDLSMSKGRIQHFADMAFRIPATSNTGPRQPFNFLTDKVVEITCQCLMAQAEEADRSMLDDEMSQRLIIEEFGRCLKEIIDSGHKAETS